MWNNILDIAKDLIGAYGFVIGAAILTFVLRWVAANAKSVRLRETAEIALRAVSSVDNSDLTNEQKKKEAIEKLNKSHSNNFSWGTITEDELDMHIESAVQRLRSMQVSGTSNTENEVK